MISLIKDIILEANKQKFDYGCAMLYFDMPEMEQIQSYIEENDLYTGDGSDGRNYGMETDPHCTLLYGLHEEVTLDQVKHILDQLQFHPLVLHNASTFNNPKYDVLKFDVRENTKGLWNQQSIFRANEALTKLPHTTDYPDFHPHSTIAYLKPGTGKKYVDMLKDMHVMAYPKKAVYSMPSGKQYNIKIKTDGKPKAI